MRIFTFLFFISLFSCNIAPKNDAFQSIFSFTEEIARLTIQNPSVFKQIVSDDITRQSETKIDWKKELAFFANAEINFKKFQDQYTIDSVINGSKLVINCLSYSPDIKTKQIQYVFNNGICEMVYMQRMTFSRLNNSHQEMYYQPGVGYQISGTQNVKKIAQTTYKIKGKIMTESAPKWLVNLAINDTTFIPFWLDLNEKEAIITNGEEQIKITKIENKGDSIILDIPVFNAEFRITTQNNTLSGYWYNFAKGDYKLPLTATQNASSRFPFSEEQPLDFGGKWDVTFSPNSKHNYPAIGVFEQKGNKVTGTFLTETGDYRFLEGVVNGNKLAMSCFDGAHAFLFEAFMDSEGAISGTFFSGKHWQESWIAKRNEKAQLANPYQLTYLLDTTKEFLFSFPNADSIMVSNKDKKYQNKAIIVQIMGSWCPNCMDESKFLEELYTEYHADGLEIISLCFEPQKDFRKAVKGVQKLKTHFNSTHEYLLAGYANKKAVNKALPQLSPIVSFPTSLFIDKKGKVRKIHTGFYGPSTGPYYEMYVKETKVFVAELLNE